MCVVRVMYGHMQDIVFAMPWRDAEVATRRYGTIFFLRWILNLIAKLLRGGRLLRCFLISFCILYYTFASQANTFVDVVLNMQSGKSDGADGDDFDDLDDIDDVDFDDLDDIDLDDITDDDLDDIDDIDLDDLDDDDLVDDVDDVDNTQNDTAFTSIFRSRL